eukprot:gnl/Spiro4/24755_TR12303_c0_g1_i1.p1 gnl/Spiro4/24755_TR12303_c0_g1~~gnl/Spiro4/24755_TR12303_c0_g1_i1.p1  ORF type:complete len:517 (-),score=133.34 gnl/Spiro4/24755_TR12303_c0_g1_i1:229-1749(-)
MLPDSWEQGSVGERSWSPSSPHAGAHPVAWENSGSVLEGDSSRSLGSSCNESVLAHSEISKAGSPLHFPAPVRAVWETSGGSLRSLLREGSFAPLDHNMAMLLASNRQRLFQLSRESLRELQDTSDVGEFRHMLRARLKMLERAKHVQTAFSETRVPSWLCMYRRQLYPPYHSIKFRLLLGGHSNFVNSVTTYGWWVASAGDRTVRVWYLDPAFPEVPEPHILLGHSHTVWCLAMDSRFIVSGSEDADVRVWELSTMRCRFILRGHTATVMGVGIHEQFGLSGSHDTTVRVWDIVAGTCLRVLTGHVAMLATIGAEAASPVFDCDVVASGSCDATSRVWNWRTGECLHVLTGHTKTITCVAFSRDWIFTGSHDRSLRLWDKRTGHSLHVFTGHMGEVFSCRYHGGVLFSSAADRTIRIWDPHMKVPPVEHADVVAPPFEREREPEDATQRATPESPQCVRTLHGHQGGVWTIACGDVGLVSGAADRTVRVWSSQWLFGKPTKRQSV